MAIDYKQAGVDVQAGDDLVNWLKASAPARGPHHEKLIGGLGGFAALFKADFKHFSDPCLVSCTDGVGTKLKLAAHFESYREVAQDLVAMCVNDLVCSGAEPLFFLDYYASGRLRLDAAKQFLGGVQDACGKSHCALIGGETAEMPDVYAGRDFDCAGFAVGVVDRPKILGPERVTAGMRLIGIASSGFHSNGFSLLRRVFAEDLEAWRAPLLEPTSLYVDLVLAARNHSGLAAVAHITGGGLGNLPRVIPPGLRAELKSWPVPETFREVKKRAGLDWSSMLETLNCGVGMIWVVAPDAFADLTALVKQKGFGAFDLGDVREGAHGWRFRDGEGF